MPRSKRRKGARQKVQQMRRDLARSPETTPRPYYDPGARPMPRNLARSSSSSTSSRHNHQRGS